MEPAFTDFLGAAGGGLGTAALFLLWRGLGLLKSREDSMEAHRVAEREHWAAIRRHHDDTADHREMEEHLLRAIAGAPSAVDSDTTPIGSARRRRREAAQ